MGDTDTLQVIAEVGIALAGFSGLFIAFRRKSGPLDDVQKFRMSLLFILAFGATFLSFVPAILADLSVPDEQVRAGASASLLLYSSFLLLWWFGGSRRLAKVVPEIFNWYAFTTMSVGHVIVLVLQLGVVLGLFDARAPGVFAMGLVWYLVHAAQQFVRMLYIHPKD